jgi:hypothetical protein
MNDIFSTVTQNCLPKNPGKHIFGSVTVQWNRRKECVEIHVWGGIYHMCWQTQQLYALEWVNIGTIAQEYGGDLLDSIKKVLKIRKI